MKRMSLTARLGVLATGVLAVAAGMIATHPATVDTFPSNGGELQAVIIQTDGDSAALVRAIDANGGRIERELPIINGMQAYVPSGDIATLRAYPGVLAVTPDLSLESLGKKDKGGSGTSTAPATFDAGSMALITQSTGARDYWNSGYTGKGVDVAIIDTGIAPVNGLSAPGKVVLGPDLSFESQSKKTRYLDTNGHGTHLSGIIAGRDDSVSGKYQNNTTDFIGMAPDSRLVSVKVGDSYGHADVSQVIAAIDWVVQHKNDNGLNVRVLNIAFGTNSKMAWWHDPLVQAAEVAWRNGIFVVVSAGNDGEGPKFTGALSNLAKSPNLMTVGATDTVGTLRQSDDCIPSFSSSGDFLRRVDVVAPGKSVISLKAPGSFADESFGATATYNDRFFRGSGTSQAAAVVSGAAALVIQQHPDISPTDLKNLLRGTATQLDNEKPEAQGAGQINLASARTATVSKTIDIYIGGLDPLRTFYETGISGKVWSDGRGSIDEARGTHRLVHKGVELRGDIDIFAAPYDSTATAVAREQASSWSSGWWNGNKWTASSWSASSWSASSWSASSWSASSWSASSWSASSWSASSWSASSWSASSWSASSWSASSWSASSWSSAAWE
ncbi:MAG: S8 family serine peptidase [Dehalococcoidia bacterium]|nr:S8 family serine peptidase [Dehalococcoidia bacterium]